MDYGEFHTRAENQSCCIQLDEEGKGSDSGIVEDERKEYEEGTGIVDFDAKGVDVIHANIAEEKIPKIGMEFGTEEDAYDFYNSYAHEMGFSIRRSKGHKDRNGRLQDRVFCCSCQGKREKDKRDGDVRCHRPETRCGCLAELKVNSRFNGKYRVVKFVSEHTHGLVSSNERTLLRSHKNMTQAQTVECDMIDKSIIAPKPGVKQMARRVGWRENISFIPEEYKNYLHSRRTVEMKVGDTGAILEYLQNMQFDPNFSYAIQVDLDDLITNIFWADARMKLDYVHFGDCVCLDTSYRKNEEGRPFVLFIGVNHHKESIIFGAALLYDETCETFMWLFNSFVMAMSGKNPKTILTDQDPAMEKALASRWPETHHRLCVWQIYQNAIKHLNDVCKSFSGFTKDLSSCLYDHDDEEEDFINAWNEMLGKYNLKNNAWLKGLFELREKWALVYGRQIFCAEMSTTRRSDNMNNQIKSYIRYNYDLLYFFHQFQKLVDDMRYEELKADLKATQSRTSLPHQVEIMKHAASIYTPSIFEIFNKEIWLTWDCELHNFGDVGTVTKYKIIPPGKPRQHIVTFDSLDCSIICSCKKFESVGILCAHALKVLFFQNFKRVPDRYILKRWTQDAKVVSGGRSCGSIRSHETKMDIGSRYKNLWTLYTQLAARASLTEKSYKIAMDGHENTLNEVEASLKNLSVEDDTVRSSCGKAKDRQSNESALHDDGSDNICKGIVARDIERVVKRKRPQSESLSQTQQSTQRTDENDYGPSLVGSDGSIQFRPPSQLKQQLNLDIYNPNLDIFSGSNRLPPSSQITETRSPQNGNQEK